MDRESFGQIIQKANIFSHVEEVSLPVLQNGGRAEAFAGEIIVEGRLAKLGIPASRHFPKQSPLFYLLNHQDFGRLPHVDDDGQVCYKQDDAVVLDIHNPVGVMQACFGEAVRTLTDGVTGKNADDFYNEYEAYWGRLLNTLPLLTNIRITDKVSTIKFAKFHNRDVLFASDDDQRRLITFEKLFEGEKSKPKLKDGLFVPLQPGKNFPVPEGKQPLSIGFLRDLVWNNITEENKRALTIALAVKKSDDILVFCLPQPKEHYSLFGVRFSGINYASHPLLIPSTKSKLVPLTVTRVDPEFMLTRGGNGQNYLHKKVLVIGAGSVGGYVCEELVKAAVVNIDVLDKDTLQPENCYRHACGFKYLLEKKPIAVKKKLESFYPHANINAVCLSVESALEKGKVNLSSYDAIIVATGNPTINQYLNEVFREQTPGTPLVFCWLDPYGIGGHCLLTNLPGAGCFQCLYSNDALHNIASFAHREQPKSFSKSIAGCGTTYVPYGSLDAAQTAILTVRKVLDVFSGTEKQNAIFSWKGNDDLFLSQGYRLSIRYRQNAQQLEAAKCEFYQTKCEACGKK